jgi:ELWxxDGT repeat protein
MDQTTPTAVLDGKVFFPARDGGNGREPWESDGTQDGTAIVRDVNPGGSSSPSGLIALGGTVFFAADDGEHGVELWATRPLDNVRPCPDDASVLCVHGPADFTAEGRDIRILAEAGNASITVRGDENDIAIEEGFTGRVGVIGDETTIDGSDGGDEIATIGCNNSVRSRAGDDRVVVDDVDNCPGSTAVVRAGRGADFVLSKSSALAIFRGERDDDVIVGGGGDDRLYGGDGEDQIRGRAGDDDVRGGRDGDRIRGGRGDDLLRGRADEDVVRGGRGRDSVHGNTGDDVLHGNRGRDRLFGGKHDDSLFGGKRADFMDGGFGIDVCSGGRGNDAARGCED